MAEEFDSASAGFWLPDEFLDDDFFSSDEKAAVAAGAKSDSSSSDEEEPLGGLSRRMAGLDSDGTIVPKVVFRFRSPGLFGISGFCCFCLEPSDCLFLSLLRCAL